VYFGGKVKGKKEGFYMRKDYVNKGFPKDCFKYGEEG
jgi:hypothetical protein